MSDAGITYVVDTMWPSQADSWLTSAAITCA